jgi:hypothetical protein
MEQEKQLFSGLPAVSWNPKRDIFKHQERLSTALNELTMFLKALKAFSRLPMGKPIDSKAN